MNPLSADAVYAYHGWLKNFLNLLKFGTEVPIVDSDWNKFMRIERKNSVIVAENSSTRPAHKLPGTEEVLALANTPDVRASEVARGKMLIADPNYPSRDQIRHVARVIVKTWRPSSAQKKHAIATAQ